MCAVPVCCPHPAGASLPCLHARCGTVPSTGSTYRTRSSGCDCRLRQDADCAPTNARQSCPPSRCPGTRRRTAHTPPYAGKYVPTGSRLLIQSVREIPRCWIIQAGKDRLPQCRGACGKISAVACLPDDGGNPRQRLIARNSGAVQSRVVTHAHVVSASRSDGGQIDQYRVRPCSPGIAGMQKSRVGVRKRPPEKVLPRRIGYQRTSELSSPVAM